MIEKEREKIKKGREIEKRERERREYIYRERGGKVDFIIEKREYEN